MLSRGRAVGLGAVAALLLVACEIFAVRMPSHATAGSSITIEMDMRYAMAASVANVVVHCARLPSTWAVTQARYSRTIAGVTTAGSLTANTGTAARLNADRALAGHTWVCHQAPSATYATNDFGTSKLTVTVQTPGSYEIMFAMMSSDTTGLNVTRRFTVDAVPDWRFDSRSTNLPTARQDWSSVKAVTDLGLVATDLEGNVHVSADGGGSWLTNDIAAGTPFFDIERLGNLTIAVGGNGAIYTATNLMGTWTSRSSGSTTTSYREICTDGTTLYAVGDPAYVATSVNGTTWFGAAAPFVLEGCAAIPGGGAVGVGANGQVVHITHTGAAPAFSGQATVVAGSPLHDAVYVATPTPRLAAFANGSAWVREVAGTTWTRTATAPMSTPVRAVSFGDTVYVVGDSGQFSGASVSNLDAWTSYGTGTIIRIADIAVTGKVVSLVGDRGVRLRIGVPSLAFDGTSLTLERTEPGVARSASFTVRNDGKGVLYTSAPVIGAPFTASYDCDGALTEGEACAVTVTIATTTRGVHTGTLTVPSSSAVQRSVTVIALVGNDATVSATLDGTTPVSAVDFGSVAVGARVSRDVLVRNAGDAPLTVGSVASLAVPATPFAIADNACTGQTLAAGATCPITVTFKPTGEAGAMQAFDIVSSDTAHPRIIVQLLGTGAPAADIRTAEALVFPETPVGDSAQVGLLVTNVGRGPLEVRSIAATGDGFGVADDAVFTVAAGESVERFMRFAPAAEGTLTGQLVITSNDPDQPEQVVTMTAIALAGSGAKHDGGCAAAGGSLLTLLTICAFGAHRCATHRRRTGSE